MTDLESLTAAIETAPDAAWPLKDEMISCGTWDWEHVHELVCRFRRSDGPRLLAADWFESQGRNRRAELIRVQLRSDGFSTSAREADLLFNGHPVFPDPPWKVWVKEEMGGGFEPALLDEILIPAPSELPVVGVRFRRGFVEELNVGCADFAGLWRKWYWDPYRSPDAVFMCHGCAGTGEHPDPNQNVWSEQLRLSVCKRCAGSGSLHGADPIPCPATAVPLRRVVFRDDVFRLGWHGEDVRWRIAELTPSIGSYAGPWHRSRVHEKDDVDVLDLLGLEFPGVDFSFQRRR